MTGLKKLNQPRRTDHKYMGPKFDFISEFDDFIMNWNLIWSDTEIIWSKYLTEIFLKIGSVDDLKSINFK